VHTVRTRVAVLAVAGRGLDPAHAVSGLSAAMPATASTATRVRTVCTS